MALHGHVRSDLRHLHLHRVAIAKLRKHPELRGACLVLLDDWLGRHEHAPSAPWLRQWREMLASWTMDELADVVLDPEGGQTLRQCLPSCWSSHHRNAGRRSRRSSDTLCRSRERG